MLSLQQAIEIKKSILAYLEATFSFQDRKVHKAFFDFVTDEKNGMFKGPYLSLRLPFVTAGKDEEEKIPLDIKPSWAPYDHQVKAWHRLSSKDKAPEPTIVTTGTGSGKTESFMFPVLDYCFKNLNRPGIKVIILYPMNALATDQAKRLAEAIYEDDRLKGKVTAGLFLGEGENPSSYPKTMGPDHIIENRGSILDSPPDILLTNYKMLDYGLMKSTYQDLWLGNLQDTDLLKYLVLDELHTYDGAQGTDVANLIRRLKLKLKISSGQLCPVGTSATIGSGAEAPSLLAEYASKIFGEKIEPDCVVTENRQSLIDFFGPEEKLEPFLPRTSTLKDLKPLTHEGYENYISRQIQAWQLDKADLAKDLTKLKIVKDLVEVTNYERGLHTINALCESLSDLNEDFKKVPQWDPENSFSPKKFLIHSLYALIAEAKVGKQKKIPYLYSQAQLWIRELSGILREIREEPIFTWKDHQDSNDPALALPPWYCRECGASGWLGMKHDNKERFEKDILDTYAKFFSNHKHVYFANLTKWFSLKDATEAGYEPTNSFQRHVYNRNLEFHNESDEGRVDITAFRKLNNKGYNDHVCPECNTRNTISIIGTRTATLSSIGVSQTLSTDLDSNDEQNRKVLAFTNSVQDAAHQAGFVEARNYRFTFRSSLQKVINSFESPKNLKELSIEFKEYWKKYADEKGDKSIDAYYFRFYPTDYLGKSSPEDYKENKRYSSEFQREFDSRMDWEVFAEFGYNSLIGRTLEKTGSSAVHFDRKSIEKVWGIMEPWLESNEPSGTIEKNSFIKFVILLLHRIRQRGAIEHEYLNKFRTGDLKRWDLNWNKDSRHFLNKRFGPQTRIPKPITGQRETRGVIDTTYTLARNWYHSYFIKSFQSASNHKDLLNEMFDFLLDTLHKCELLDKKEAKDIKNYALLPDKIMVDSKVIDYVCDTCGNQIHTSDVSRTATGGKCLNYRCTGEYFVQKGPANPNYYQLVYNRNRSPRIYAADHTGLLEREKREELEIDFKTRPNFNSKNAMVATSTLEMGIDIGSLNVAYNNSVPPLPSNFLQRVGRAGRASGSALIVNFVQSKAHDLFYYREPLDMMAGEVSTPGCYLEAMEILKRHFFAFSLDSWALENPKENNIPSKILYLKLTSSDLSSPDFFMNRILGYIKSNEGDLFNYFISSYHNDVRPEVIDELKGYLENEAFYHFHRKIFIKLKDEINFIAKKKKEVIQRITDLNLGEEDPETIELKIESKNLQGIIRSIKNRNTLEHLTNVGALPNYAFPETGVTLNAKVLGKKAEGSNKTPLIQDFEIVRSASQAIREFAPDNLFYSQGYKFLITGVNTFDWADKENFCQKRFCSKCDHIERAEMTKTVNCPKCGDPSWGASSNVHSYAKLISVKSFNNRADASLNDSTDERENLVYNVLKHFDFNKSTSHGGWAMKDIPFGIEFVGDVTVTDTNLGRADVANSRKIKINDLEVPAHGFITCRHCGKSTSNIHQRVNNQPYKPHYGYCKHKEEEYKGKADEVFEEVFFFREIKTEALKILLPVQDFNSESEIKMFQAGIELGLKTYFSGNQQHIRICDYREYNHRIGKFDRYLVLYDTIPGGTGYLEKLFDRDEFNKLLEGAYKEIAGCNCKNEGKDGCYRCIFSYSNQYYQSELSRERAERRFKSILSKSQNWESFPSGLGNITNSGQIEESELEERFIRSLRLFAKNDDRWTFNKRNVQGTINYTLNYESGAGSTFSYHITPQVPLGPANGIEFPTKPDFLFYSTYARLNGEKVEDLQQIPRLAIYLDGYQFHASEDNNRFSQDYRKRQGINFNPEYHTWTLTWEDLEKFDQRFIAERDQINRSDFLYRKLEEDGYKDTKKALVCANKKPIIPIYEAQNNMERLLFILEYPIKDEFFKRSWSLYLGMFQKKSFMPSYSPDDLFRAFEGESLDQYCIKNKTLDGLVIFDAVPQTELFALKTLINVDQHKVISKCEVLEKDKIDKTEWNQFWILYNILQFFSFTPVEKETDPDLEYQISDLLDSFDPEYHSIVKQIYDEGLVQTEEEEKKLYALSDDRGNVIAEADLIVYKTQKVYEPFSEEDEKVFKENGFDVISKSDNHE